MSIAGALRSWWADRQAENEYHALRNSERADIARDLRLSESTLGRILEQGASRPLQLPRMLDALHVDLAEVRRGHPGVMRDLEATCAGCSEHAQCGRDLDRHIAAGGYQAYCPNAVTIDALIQEQAEAVRTAA